MHSRRRHVKCGEEKPTCKQCQRSSFTCGYVPLPRQSDPTLQPQVSVAPAQVKPTWAELELNHYCRTQVIMTNSGCEFTSELWHLHVLQGSREEAAIWHACNYFAAVSRLNRTSHSGTMNIVFGESLRQYSAALKSIMKVATRRKLSIPDKSAILVVNALLVVSSFRSGKLDEAVTIISNSIRLLQEWDFQGYELQSPCPVPMMLLALFFVKIERVFQNCFLVSTKLGSGWEKVLSTLQDMPIVSSVGACLELEMLWNESIALIGNLSFQPSAQEVQTANTLRAAFRHRFVIWTLRYQIYRQSQLTKVDHARNGIMNIRQMLVDILLRVDMANLETSWDEFDDEFAQATILAEFIAKRDMKESVLTPLKAMLLKVLHFMAKVCRNPALRRKMVTLIREKFENSSQNNAAEASKVSRTQIIDAIIELEETAWYAPEEGRNCSEWETGCVAGEVICNYHRVAEVHANINPSLRFNITLRTVGDMVNNRPGHTRRVTAWVFS